MFAVGFEDSFVLHRVGDAAHCRGTERTDSDRINWLNLPQQTDPHQERRQEWGCARWLPGLSRVEKVGST